MGGGGGIPTALGRVNVYSSVTLAASVRHAARHALAGL